MSAYAPPSISKIKQDSISKAKFDKLETIKNLTVDAFSKNPAFLETNPNSSRNKQIYIDTLAKKGYDVSDLQQLNPVSQENKEAIGDILNPGFLDGMANDAAEGVKQGGGQVLKGVEKMYDPRSSLKEIVTGGTNAVAGTIKTGFSLAGAVVPELLLFNAATKTVKSLPGDVKSTLMEFGNSAQGLTEEQKVENFDKTIDFPFAAASIIAEGMGYKPEEESFGKALLEITDIVLPLALGKAGSEIKSRVKDINDIKEISKKITENKATEQELKDYVAISKATEKVSVEEVKDHSDLSNLEKDHNVSPEESKLHSDLEESFSDQKKISDAGLPPSDIVDSKISNIQNEIKQINEREGLFGINDAFDAVEKASKADQVKVLEETKNVEGLSESAKAEIDKQIEGIKPKELVKELRSDSELEMRMSELEDSGLKFQSKEAAEFNVIEKEMEKRERESVFNVPLEKASEAIDVLIKKEKDQPNGYGSFVEKRDASESKEVIDKYLDPSEMTDGEVMKDFVDALRGNPSTWYADGLQLRESVKEASKRGIGTDKLISEAKEVYLKDGYSEKDASEVIAMFLEPLLKGAEKGEVKPVEVKVVEDYDGGSYSKGKTSEDIAKEQGVEFSSPEEADRHISEESQNPLEIANRYLQLDIESAKDTKAYADQLLDASGIKLTREEFAKIADKNIINESISKKFLNENPEIHFDKKLEEINEVNGTNISHEDLVDYIRRADAENYVPQESGIRTKFRNRFKELTGQELTPSKAKLIIESEVKKLNKEYEKFIGKEYGSYAEAEQGYYDAIKSGEIAIEGGEVVSIPGRSEAAQERLAELDKLVDSPERAKAIASEKKKLEKELDKSDGKKLKLGERILDSDNVSDGIKVGLMKKGIEYIPIDMEVTLNDAKAYVKEFDVAGELDKAIANVTNTSNKMPGVNRGVIGKELFEVLADKAKNAETISEQKKWQDKAVEIATFTADNFRKAGQEINAAKVWKRMLEMTPEGAISAIKQSYIDNNKAVLDANKTSIKDAKSFLDDFLKSKDFESIVGEKVKSELAKLNKGPQKGNIFNSKSVRDSRKSELKAKWEQAKNSSLSSSIVGLNKEQIEIAGEMALLHIIDGVVKVGELAVKLKKDFDTITPEQVNKLWEEHKIADKTIAEYAKEKATEKFEERTINDALKIFSGEVQNKLELKAFRESVKELNKKEFLDTWNKKLKNLKPENRRNLLGKVIAEIESLGGLSDQRFKEMYAEEMGLKTLTPEAEQHVRKLIDTINKSEKSGAELQGLFDKDAAKSEIEAKKKEWINDVFEGNKANGELSQYFKHEKKLGNTMATLLQGNLLGPLSLVKNVYSNTLIQPLRSASRGISSMADYAMSKAASLPVLNKIIKDGRTIDALAYWKGASKGIRPGLNTAVKEMIRGINPEEMIERDKNQSLEPLKSMSRFYEGLTGKEKQTVYQQLNNFTEGVFGLPAEGMFRLLNLGDKPFRKSAEFGAAYELGTLKGLKGKELEKFVLFPDEVSAKEIKKQAEKAVYQQSEGATKAIQNGLRTVEDFLSDSPILGDVWKVGFKSIIPYVKTPLNIIGETIKFALPEYSIAKGIYDATNGNRAASLKSFGDAVVGLSIRQGVSALISNNLVTGSGDYRDKEATAIQQQNVPPSSINISGLQRMLSGGNPAIKDKDTWINYNNMGVVGIMLGIHSNQIGLKESDKSYLSEMSTMLPTIAQTSLEQSFLQGTNSFLEAVGDKDGRVMRKWAINNLGTLGAIAYPNTLTNISKAVDNTARNVKDESFGQELVNNFKTKMFQGDKLPSKVNLWGQKVHGAPEGRNKYLWYLLDVTKFKDVPTGSYNYKIFDLWKNAETPEEKRYILPNIPLESVTVKKEKVKLSSEQYEKYQMYVGKNRADLVRKYAESPNWEKDNQERKIKKLKDMYSDGLNNGKRLLFIEYPELRGRKKMQ